MEIASWKRKLILSLSNLRLLNIFSLLCMAATVYMAIFLYNAVSPPVLFHNLPLLSAFCSKPKSCLLHKGDQALEQVA